MRLLQGLLIGFKREIPSLVSSDMVYKALGFLQWTHQLYTSCSHFRWQGVSLYAFSILQTQTACWESPFCCPSVVPWKIKISIPSVSATELTWHILMSQLQRLTHYPYAFHTVPGTGLSLRWSKSWVFLQDRWGSSGIEFKEPLVRFAGGVQEALCRMFGPFLRSDLWVLQFPILLLCYQYLLISQLCQ